MRFAGVATLLCVYLAFAGLHSAQGALMAAPARAAAAIRRAEPVMAEAYRVPLRLARLAGQLDAVQPSSPPPPPQQEGFVILDQNGASSTSSSNPTGDSGPSIPRNPVPPIWPTSSPFIDPKDPSSTVYGDETHNGVDKNDPYCFWQNGYKACV